MHIIQTILIKSPKNIKHMKNMFIQTILLRYLEIMQCHLCLRNIAGEERVRRNVGEVTTNFRDPEKNS